MKKLIIAAMLLVLNIIPLNFINAVETISPKAKAAFDQITKVWNSNEKNLRDFDRNVINNGINNISETINKSLQNINTQISLAEILNLIKTLKDQKTTLKPISTTLSNETSQALKNIFNATKDFYKKLIETQKIVVKAQAEPELIGNMTSFDKLAQGILVIIKSAVEDHNANPALLPLKLTNKEKEQEKKAFDELKNTKLYEVIIKK